MANIPFDREKYLRILKAEGLHQAITALHHDMESWELLTFEGPNGYSRELWDQLPAAREFSRELWDEAMNEGHPAPAAKH